MKFYSEDDHVLTKMAKLKPVIYFMKELSENIYIQKPLSTK